MIYTIEEQNIRNKNYDSPILFIEEYCVMYNKQSRVPYKVFYSDIEYSQAFEKSLYKFLLENTKVDFLRRFLEIENTVLNIKKNLFYDLSFYNLTVTIFVKCIAVILDSVFLEAMNNNFNNVDFLYYYDISNINLYNIIVNDVVRYIQVREVKSKDGNLSNEIIINPVFWFRLAKGKENLKIINKKLSSIKNEETCKNSVFANNHNLLKRIAVPELLIGKERVSRYEEGVFYCIMLNKIKDKLEDCCIVVKYNFIVNLTSEIVLRGVEEDDKNLKDFVAYSKMLLDKV